MAFDAFPLYPTYKFKPPIRNASLMATAGPPSAPALGPFKNVLIIGASGSIGSIITKALLAEPSLRVTALQRASSKAILPRGLKLILIDDDYPDAELVAAFRGHDAVLNTLNMGPAAAAPQQRRFIDAAIAAGVRRFVPSEYGLNNANPAAQAVSAVFARKGAAQAYLRQRQREGAGAGAGAIEWTAFTTGLWLRWNMDKGFAGMRARDGRFVLWDGGRASFSASTEENTARAVVRSLTTHTAETRNRNVFLQDFRTSQAEVLAELEGVLGRRLETENVDGDKTVRELKALEAAGDETASLRLIEPGFVLGIGAWFEEEGAIMNDILGLPKTNLREVVKEAVKTLKLA